MKKKNFPIISGESCILCGRCIEACPKDYLINDNNKIVCTTDDCMLCAHCYSACAESAVSFDSEVLRQPEFSTFEYKESHCTPEEIDAGELVNIFRSRRSIRKFKPDKISDEMLLDMAEFAATAPSGSNCQDWEFVFVNGREKVWNLALEMKNFFIRLNRAAGNFLIRYASVPFIGTALVKYYREHMDSVKMAIEEAESGRDLLFHGAPSLVILHSHLKGSLPVEDAQYASYNITLLAHALGLGTCYIGYAVEALNRMSGAKKLLGIPERNRIHAVLAAGYPDIEFKRPAMRKPFKYSFADL